MMKNFIKTAIFAIFLISKGLSQNLLYHVDLTDTTKITFGDYTWEGDRKITQVQGGGTYNPVFYQPDTSKQPLWRKGEGTYFKRTKQQHLLIYSGQKNFPSTATIIIIARHLGREPNYNNSYILGDTASIIGYDDRAQGLRIHSTSGGYFGRRIDEYGGLKTILSFRVKSNFIDTMFINGFTETGSLTIGNNLKGGIIGAFYSGVAVNRWWSGYIYEILVYDAALTNKQLDSLHQILSDKHHIGYKIIEPDPVPHSTQPLQGTGKANDPYLIYTAWHLDSLRFIYPKYPDSTVYVKLMNDIDLSNHPNLTIDTLCINLDGNNKKLKNLARDIAKTNEQHVLFNSIANTNLTLLVKNLTIENFTIFSPAGRHIPAGVSFLYSYSVYFKVNADNVIFIKSFIKAESRTGGFTVKIFPISYNMDYATRIGFIDCEIIISSNSRTSYLFNNNNIDKLFFNKNTVLGCYFTDNADINTIVSNANGKIHKNMFFRNKTFIVLFSEEEESFNFPGYGSGLSLNTSRNADKVYFVPNVIYTTMIKPNISISYDSWENSTFNLDSTFIDTIYNRKFHPYPTSTYSGNLPQVKTTSEMKQQSTYVSFDFDSIWAINPSINDGYPYLTFSAPEVAPLKVTYPNTTITKMTRDTLNIQFISTLDTTEIYFINKTDTIFITKTTNLSYLYKIPPKKYGLSKILIRSTDGLSQDASDTTFNVISDTTITIYEPYLYQQYNKGDTARVIFNSDLDTAKFYFRFKSSSSWEYKGIKAVTDTLDTFKIYLNYDFTDEAQIMITNKDSTITKTSDFFYIIPLRFIEILEPKANNITIYNSGLFVKVRSKNLSDFNLYVKLNDDYIFHKNYLTANSGGIDTTSFILDYKQYLLSGNLTIMVRKGDIGEIKGSMDTAYYKHYQFTFAGRRSPYQQYQSKTNYSKIFELSDNLYSISFYAFPYGWYDWYDRVGIWKFDTTSNYFNLAASRVFPNIAPYPTFLFYRTGTYSSILLKPNEYYFPIHYSFSPDTIYNTLGSPVYISGLYPTPKNIDSVRTLEVQKNFWKYKIEGSKIYAYDLKNPGNNFMLADATTISNLVGINPNTFELFAGAGKLFVTNYCYQHDESPANTFFVDLFPENNILTMDEETVFITGTIRNTFRGIYPKAIIRVIPKL